MGDMTDKILCPWCGAEMAIKTVHHDVPGIIYARGAKKREQRWNAWTSCTNDDCAADGPIVAELESEQEAIDTVKAAAIRRYTPPIKPMTLEEAYEAEYCYLEHDTKGMDTQIVMLDRMSTNARNESRVSILEFGEDEDYCVRLECADYGKTWRCWERKPTEEERSAAEWKD